MTISRMDVPIGTVLDYAGSSIPSGYLECDGSAVSRTTYAKLFAAIGTAWGAGDGSTTFNLPNLGGRACIGKGSRSVGSMGGSETHMLTTDEMPAHKHTMDSSGATNTGACNDSTGASTKSSTGGESSHTHGLNSHTHASPANRNWISYNYGSGSGTITTGVGKARANATSGNDYVPRVQNASVDFSRSGATAGPSTPNTTAGSNHSHDMSHTHNLNNHKHSVPDHLHTMQNSGGGSAHSIMQPYAVVRKVIRAA